MKGCNVISKQQIFTALNPLTPWYWLCSEYIEGAVDSRTGKVYIAVKQISCPTDILLCCWC